MEEKHKENCNSDTEVNWLCECGKVNFGNFCVVCGKPRPLVKEEQQQVETSTAGTKDEKVSQAGDRQPVTNEEILPQKARKERIKLGDKTILKIGIGISIVAFVVVCWRIRRRLNNYRKRKWFSQKRKTNLLAWQRRQQMLQSYPLMGWT